MVVVTVTKNKAKSHDNAKSNAKARPKFAATPNPEEALRGVYLQAVEIWRKSMSDDGNDSDGCWCATDNLQSLLLEIVNEKNSKKKNELFSMFVESYGRTSCCIDNETTSIQATIQILDKIAKEKILVELNSLYEEYTFATAKDASLTDDLRRRRQEQSDTSTTTTTSYSEDSLVYGEIDFEGFCDLLQSLPASTPSSSSSNTDDDANNKRTTPARMLHSTEGKGRFYDLGSGSGRAVFAARFMGDFEQCVGIELLENLHGLATSVKSLYKFLYSHKLHHLYRSVDFYGSDLLDYDWSDGTVVYAPSLLFDNAMMDAIAHKAMQLRSGAYLISLKKFQESSSLDMFHKGFEMLPLKQNVFSMSWGDANVYLYRRR